MAFVEHYEMGSIVGEEPTCGVNGMATFVDLSGNFRIMYTGMKILKNDKTQHHTIGIIPTHTVTLTVEGIRRGEDELVEKAISIINSNTQ